MKNLYQGVKNVTDTLRPSIDTKSFKGGGGLLSEREVKQKWEQYCHKLHEKIKITIPNAPNLIYNNE